MNESDKSLSDCPFALIVLDGVAAQSQSFQSSHNKIAVEAGTLLDAFLRDRFEGGALKSLKNSEALAQCLDLVIFVAAFCHKKN